MANKLTTAHIVEPTQNRYFRYLMDEPKDLLDRDHICPLDTEAPLYIDVETHKTSYEDVRTVQLFQKGWPRAVIFDTNHYTIQSLYDVIKDFHVVAHMSTMELSCFQNDLKPSGVPWREYYPDNPFKKFSDTFLLARQALFRHVDGFSLDKVAAYIHGTDHYVEYAKEIGASDPAGYKKFMQKSFLDTPKSNKRNQPLHEEQLVYGALDVMVMPTIYEQLKGQERKFIVTLDYLFIDHCVQYQHEGLPFHEENWKKHWEEQTAIMAESTAILPEGLNPRSYKQVRAMLNSAESDDAYLAQVVDGSDLVVCPISVTGATAEGLIEASSLYQDEPELLGLRQEYAKALRAFRSAVKRTEYLRAYEAQYARFGRVKGYVSPRTISGRIASDEVNMTNIPRSLKNIFGYPQGDERRIIYADYSQLELRMTAAILNEHVMIDKFMADEDLHVFAATQVYDKHTSLVTKGERFIGKFFNFSGTYGAGVARLCTMLLKEAGIYMTEDDMRPLHRNWKATFPALGAWHRANGRSKDNIDFTLLGRGYKAKLYTDLNAIKMQGSSAEVFKLAHIYMVKNAPDIRIGDAVHDSFIGLEKSLERAKEKAYVIAWCKMVAWFEVIQNAACSTLKMPVEALVGSNWGDIDGEGIYEYSYTIDGNYQQYQAAKNYVTRGTLLENKPELEEIRLIEQENEHVI